MISLSCIVVKSPCLTGPFSVQNYRDYRAVDSLPCLESNRVSMVILRGNVGRVLLHTSTSERTCST